MKVQLVLLALAFFASCYFAERTILSTQNEYFNTNNWDLVGLASEEELVTVRLFLYQHNLERLNAEFERRTNPTSPMWRKWLSSKQIQKIVSPPKEKVEIVTNWIAQYPEAQIENHGDCIVIEAPVKTINQMFDTTLYTFAHKETGHNVARHLNEYSLPAEVSEQVQFVLGINGFPFVGNSFAHKHENQFDDETYKVVPYVIDQIYNIDFSLASKMTHQSTVGVAEFEDNRAFNDSDLAYFQSQNLLPSNPVPQSQIIGPFNPKLPNLESTLDIQYAGGVSYNTSNWYYTVRGWMLEFADILNSATSYPLSISMSWGWTEDNQCEITKCTSSSEYVSRVNVEFQKVGLRGITLLASSGDQGAPGDGNPDCFHQNEPITAIFPGASPYVLSIGATMLVTPYSGVTKRNDQPVPPICETQTCADPSQLLEVACSYPDALITSGGGFSVYSARPSWQDSVVTNYLNTATGLPTPYFNASNRGFPDVSALGHNYLIRIDQDWEIVDGTSCSAPVWAALVGMLNQYELDAGRPSLGFINPLIYQAYASNPSIFFDIVNGNNLCSESACCTYGYPTSAGWDAVTGLGTPNFALLLQYVQSLSS